MYISTIIIITLILTNINAENLININSVAKKGGIYMLKENGNIADGKVYIISKGKKMDMGVLVLGVKQGVWIEWHPDGRRLQETYKNGLLDGSVSLFYKNGQKEWRYTYNNGVLDGNYTKWFKNGKRRVEGAFESGLPVGLWCWRTEDGTILKKEAFREKEKGILIGYKEYTIKEILP